MKAIIRNNTTNTYLQHAQLSQGGGPGVIIDHAGHLEDAKAGDILQTELQTLAILDCWPNRNTYTSYSTAWGLPLDHVAALRRSGEPIAEGLLVAIIGTDCQLTRALWLAIPPSSPGCKAAEADKRLQEIEALIDPEHDQELLQAIQARKSDREAAYRIILPAGSGAAVGDQLSLASGLSTILAIDRRSWNGLELLVCSEPQPEGIINRIEGAK